MTNAIKLQTIGKSAFYENQISGTLTIPSSVTSIGEWAFAGVFDDSSNHISTLDLSNATSLETIGNGAFYENQISTLNLSNATSLVTIEDRAFEDNQISGTLTIPNNVRTIRQYAFQHNQIETLNVGSGLTTLGISAFGDNYINGNISYGISLTAININMTQSEWNSRNLPTNNWYSGNVIPNYNQE